MMAIPRWTRDIFCVATLFVALPDGRAIAVAPDDRSPALRFEKYEGVLGFGSPDSTRAKRDFLEAFPIGMPIDRIEAFFQKIGGRCFSLREPGKLYCGYSHPKFWLFPFWPVASTWLVSIWFKGEPRISTRIEVAGGAEGP